MVNLLPPAVPSPIDRYHNLDKADLALPPAIVQQPAVMQQIVFKLVVFKLAPPFFRLPSSPDYADFSPALTNAIHQLVQIVSQLRSFEVSSDARLEVGSEEDANESAKESIEEGVKEELQEGLTVGLAQPLTSEILATYVQEEAEDLLAALQTHAAQFDRTSSLACPPAYVWLKKLAPWWLWGVARSSYDIMRLMEGQIVRLSEVNPGSGATQQQTGVLRLMALLHLQTPQLTICLDLATYEPVASTVPPTATVQWQGMELEQPAKAVGTWLEEMTRQVQTLSPEMVPFLQGMPVEMMMPHSTWETGTLQLQLGLEFVPTGAIEFPARLHTPDLEAPDLETPDLETLDIKALGFASSLTFNEETTPLSSPPRLKITQPNWLEQYTQALHHQQFLHLLHQFPLLYTLADRNFPPSLPTLVAQADIFAQQLRANPLFNTRCFLQQELSLTDLAARLLWNLMHSGYEVMQWLSGSEVNLLQPQAPYQTGNLRFAVTLKLATPEREWLLDLATAQPPTAATLLSPQAIVQSPEHAWCQQPQLLKQLDQQIWHHLDQVTPEIRQLQQGVAIEVMSEDGKWQPGVLELAAEFEFVCN